MGGEQGILASPFGKEDMAISKSTSKLKNLQIKVEIDPSLLLEIDSSDKISTTRIIEINLYKLIYAIGTIQTRRFAPSNREKYSDKVDLLEKLYADMSEFRVRLNDIRAKNGSETLKSISEDFGVGLSVLIAESLFNLKFSTIQRIYGTKKRPDWKGQTQNNKILVVESKGSSSQSTSGNQGVGAIIQKSCESGDIKVASLSLLREHEISTTRFLDPPINPNNMESELQNKILRAGHYTSVFSFIGQSELSRYFAHMRKRISQSITLNQQMEKENIYQKIKNKYTSIKFDNKVYLGTFYNIQEDNYLFVGVDEKVISLNGFLEFEDYETEKDIFLNKNNYILFKDGILFIEIKNIQEFKNIINVRKIPNYQEFNTCSDIDSMTEYTFEKYIIFLLNKIGIKTNTEVYINGFGADIVGTLKDRKYLIEVKISRTKTIDRQIIDRLLKIRNVKDFYKVVFITNGRLSEDFITYRKRIVLIGRNELKRIVKNHNILKDMLG